MNQITQTIYNDRLVPMGQLAAIRYSYGSRLLAIVSKIKSRQLSYHQALTEIKQTQQTITQNWNAYQLTYLTAEEAQLVEQVNTQIQKGDAVIHKLEKLIEKENASALNQNIVNELFQTFGPIITNINALVELQVNVSNANYKAAHQTYLSASRNFYIFIILSLSFSIPFGFYLIKRVRKITESDAKFHVFFQHAGDAIFLLDENTRITEVNERASHLLGYTQKEFLTMKISDLFIPEDQQTFHMKLDLVKKTGGSVHERKWVKKDGQILCAEVNVRTVEGVGFISVVRDITDRNIAISKIRQSEERAMRVMQNSPIPLALTPNATLAISFINQQFTNVLGYTLEDIPTVAVWWELAYPDPAYRDLIRNEWLARVERSQTNNTPFEPMEALVCCKDKTKRHIEFHFADLGEEYLVTFYDITARKLAEEKVRKNEEKNRALIENIDDGILLLNESGDIIYQSPSVQRINGYSLDDRKNLSIDATIHQKDKEYFSQILESVKNTPGAPIQYNLRIIHKQGDILWTEGSMINLLHNPSIQAIIVTYRNITERKKATEFFRYQFENSPDYIVIINRDLTIESINKGRPNGLTAAELVGQSSIDILPIETQEIARKAIIECFNTGKNNEIENPLMNNRWVRSRFVPIVIDGVISHLIVIATDITKQKLTELSLKQSEEKHRALVENISDTIILINESYEVLYQSPSFIRTAGFSIKEIEGKTALDFVHPDDLQSCFLLIEQSKLTPGIPLPGQFRLLNKDGDYIWVEGTVNNLIDNPSVNAIVLNYRNVTERKKLEEQQLLTSAIVNSSQDAIISKTLDGKITSWNSGAEKTFGYSAAEMIGTPITNIIPSFLMPEEEIIIASIKSGNSIDHYETQRKKKNGDLIYVSLTVSPIKDASGNVVGASKVLRDISHQKLMALERERILNDVQQRNRDLEQFSYIVSHNLRGPVATILGLTDLLKTNNLEPEEKEIMIDGVSSSVSNLDSVIKDLNTILQIRREINEKRAEVSFSSLLHNVQSVLSNSIKQEQVTFITDFSKVDSIKTVKSYIYSIFYNLISNSIKFKQPGVPPVIEITSSISENKIVILIRDNGIGIDLGKKEKQVFGLYKRFHPNTEGKGVGLYMVKSQVEALDGKISVQSEVNRGTEFRIEFENDN